jgi:hypothetical protein
MKPEYTVIIVAAFFLIFILAFLLVYINDKKKENSRREKCQLRGWNYESGIKVGGGFRVTGTYSSLDWKLEKSGTKNDQMRLIFSTKSFSYGGGVFYFGDQREVNLISKPFMRYILKMGTKGADSFQRDQNRVDALSLLKDASKIDIAGATGRWQYGALATDEAFAQKIISSGLQSEVDAISIMEICKLPPSIILSPDGMEISWKIGSVDGNLLEQIIESSIRIMDLLSKFIKDSNGRI